GSARPRSAVACEHHCTRSPDDACGKQPGRSRLSGVEARRPRGGCLKRTQKIALALIGVVALASLAAGVLAPSSYSEQFRDSISARPSAGFLVGTEELGRDRFARLLYGTRISLLLAPAAALLSTMIAALIGGLAAFAGGRWERYITSGIDLFLSLPWLFL